MMLAKRFRQYLTLIICVIGFYLFTNHYSFIAALSPKKALLSPTTHSLIETFKSELEFTLYSQQNDTYHEASLLIAQYQRKNPHVKFTWKQEHYSFSHHYTGEALVAHYQNQNYFLDLSKDVLSEASITSMLFKFMRHANAWVVFLQGHGEPDIYGKESRDYSLWRKALENQGLKVLPLTLTQTPVIANNTQLIVISSPQSELLPQEEVLLAQYINQGGHVLWLIDPSSKRLSFLEKLLGVSPINGTIVDLHGQQLGTPHPAITLIEHYPKLPFSAPTLLSAYPWSVALKTHETTWEPQPILITHEATWTETGLLSGEIRFDPEQNEIAGPLLLGLSLTRNHPTLALQQQRISVIGNSRFMSNGVIENYGNLAFGQNLISWLNQDDQLVTLEQPLSTDSFANIHTMTAYLIQFGFPSTGLLILAATAYYGFKRRQTSQKYSMWLSRE